MVLVVSVAAGATHAFGTGAALAANQADWEDQILKVPFPSKGCFTAEAPKLEWRGVACATPPNVPYPPSPQLPQGLPVPQTVGDLAGDYAADVTGLMTEAIGSFAGVTGVTSETGRRYGAVGEVPNTYSLQLNTKPFTTPLCAGRPLCRGWQQFIYTTTFEQIFIQYWLLNYGGACPAGWGPSGSHCWMNGPMATRVPAQPITNLANLSLRGVANSTTDTVIMRTGPGAPYMAANLDNILSLAAAWSGVEFAIVGDCCRFQANFNPGSTIVVRTDVRNGTMNAPTCVRTSYTGETNNLNLDGAPAIIPGMYPRIESTQSNSPGVMESCASASGTGEPHEMTFSGLSYDFQATGDFILAQAGDFTVEGRQISGAPWWPANTAIHSAIAAKMGKTRVAMCSAPARLVVDGKPTELKEGEPARLPSGVTITRTGDGYLVSDSAGNSVRTIIYDHHIDLFVGLGTWPADVHGLLANANGNMNELETRDGTILPIPVSFETLYYRYGDSWRVDPGESLLSDCGEEIEHANPTSPFTVDDLDPQLRKWAADVCAQYGVNELLLDACTLDVSGLGEKAAQVYVGMPAPLAVNR
jgi:hypothetical protein